MGFESTTLKSSLKALPVLVYIKAWKTCGTETFQKHVFFQGVHYGAKGKQLQLRVPDATWRQEMTLQRKKILAAFCDACREKGLHPSLLPVECTIVT